MEYQVPQFIEVEDKIIGPLTLRQFIYIAGGGGLCVLFFSYLSMVFALLLALPVAALAASLSFYKINGKSFGDVLEAGFNYLIHTKLFLWRHQDKKRIEKDDTTIQSPGKGTLSSGRRLTRGKLSELAWSLDIRPASGELARREK